MTWLALAFWAAVQCPTLTDADVAAYTRWGHAQRPRLELQGCAAQCLETPTGKAVRACLFADPAGNPRWHPCNGSDTGPPCR